MQEVLFRILPLTITMELTNEEKEQALLECEFGTSSDCALAAEILTIIKNEQIIPKERPSQSFLNRLYNAMRCRRS
jgi:hypothetical protein